jgi:hypothetical protein
LSNKYLLDIIIGKSNKMKTCNHKKKINIVLISFSLLWLSYPLLSQKFIADYTVANEAVLRDIPVEYINKARKELVFAYQHTSHGTHVSNGMFGLPQYKSGDDVLFGLSRTPSTSLLEFRDFALEDYAPPGVVGIDLSNDETAFIQTTRNYLDAPENATVNVLMWAWSRITDHDVAGNYMQGMDSLINEYGPEGTKIGTGPGQRETPVTFVYMTGHSVKNDNVGPLKPKNQAAIIVDYCKANQFFCHDYYSIDTHDLSDTYYEDTGDNGDSDTYGGNFLEDWQNSHTLGVDWYENWMTMEGYVYPGDHTTQHITSNRKAYAMWWILARIAGWDGESTGLTEETREDFKIYPNPGEGQFIIEAPSTQVNEVRVISSLGKVVHAHKPLASNASQINMDLSGIMPGLYIVRLMSDHQAAYSSTLIIQ